MYKQRRTPSRSRAVFEEPPGPCGRAPSELVDRLIADLDADRFGVREKAMHELERLGARVEGPLRKAEGWGLARGGLFAGRAGATLGVMNAVTNRSTRFWYRRYSPAA